MPWVLKRTSHCYGSFENPQDLFWLRNKKMKFLMLLSYLGACYKSVCDGEIMDEMFRVYCSFQDFLRRFFIGSQPQNSELARL